MKHEKLTITTNFREQFGLLMLSSAWDYYSNHIKSFKEEGDNNYVATIEGSKLYTTSATLNKDGLILHSACSCPSDGEVCKHQIALFYKIRQHITDKKEAIDNERYYESLQKSYKDATNKVLLDIIFDLSKNSIYKQTEILAKAEALLDYNYAAQTINKYIAEYGNTKQTSDGFDLVLRWLKDGRIKVSDELKVMLYAFKMMKLLKEEHDTDFLAHEADYIDDDDAYLEAQMFYGEYFLNNIAKIISEKIANESAQILKLKHCRLYISNFIESVNFDFSEPSSQLLLLGFTNLSVDDDIYRALLLVLIKHNETRYSPLVHEHYFYYDLQYELLKKRNNEEELTNFVSEHLFYPPFSVIRFNELLANGNFDQAAHLMEKLIEDNKHRYYDKSSWYELLLEAYIAARDVGEVQRVAFILLNKGYYKYYALYKDSFGEAWAAYFPKFLETIAAHDALYIEVLLIENMLTELLAYFAKDPYLIYKYYERFPLEDYPKLGKYYKKAIIKMIDGRTGTRAYQKLEDNFIIIKKLLGPEDYFAFLCEIEETFRHRPSLRKVIDEFRFHLPKTPTRPWF